MINRKAGLAKKFRAVVLIMTMLAGGFLPTTSYANQINEKVEDKISTIKLVNYYLSEDEITSIITDYANEEDLSFEEALDIFYKEAEEQKIEMESNENTRAITSPNESLGKARNKGDVFYSSAWTGIDHGHCGIFYTKEMIVHSPGKGKTSKAESSHNKVGLKNGIQLQSVAATQAQRDKAANYAYNNLRNKPYDKLFIANKTTTSKLNCSSLVWNAYKKSVNIDLDANGGLGVYPGDIRNSTKTLTYAYR